MLNVEQLTKLYLVVNKLIYKHSIKSTAIYIKGRNPDVDSVQYQYILELSIAIDLLLETTDTLIYEGNDYPFYGIMSDLEFDKLLDYLIYEYELDPVPYLDFPKNSTNFIQSVSDINLGGGGDTLPAGGGPGFYLSKNASGQLIWTELTSLISDFNLL